MERDLLSKIDRGQAQAKLERVEPGFSVSESIAQELGMTVFDQEEAMGAVGKRLAMWQSGLTEQDKPIGVLFFAGPPGVGKTETAFAVKDWFNLPDENLIRLDMSDYSEPHTLSRITGAPNGYVGWREESVLPHDIINQKNKPTIVLLDEIEKADPAVLKQFLQAFDKGEINARNGDKGMAPLDFTRTLFIMTSNIASEQVVALEKGEKRRIGFAHDSVDNRDDAVQKAIKDAMKAKFPPEFLDRVDQFVRFRPLESEETRRAVLHKFVNKQNEQFRERFDSDAPFLWLTREAEQFLLDQKDDKGGRGIKRALTDHVTSKLPDVMMGMDYKGRPFVADIEEGETIWYTDVRDPKVEEVHIGNRKPTRSEKKEDPELRLIDSGLDDRERDNEDFMGGREEPPTEEEDKEVETPEDPETPERGELRFYLPDSKDGWATVDLSIVVKQPGKKDLLQLVENLPLLEKR